MSTLNFMGFESGSTTEPYVIFGACTVVTNIKRTGDYSLKIAKVTTAAPYCDTGSYTATGQQTSSGLAGSLTTMWRRVWIYIDALPGASSEEILSARNGANLKMALRINNSGNLMAFASDGTTQLGSDGATTLSTGTWNRLDVKVSKGVNAAYEIKVNGVSELSGTGNVGDTYNSGWVLGAYNNRNGQSYTIYYDDVNDDDADYPANSQCLGMYPGADGNYVTWTVGAGPADKWDCLNDRPHDGDTSYLLSTATIDQAYTAALATNASITGLVRAVKSTTVMKRNAIGASMALRLRSGSTDSDADAYGAGAGYASIGKVYVTDPATSAAWTLGALANIQVGGVEKSATAASRMTFACAMVEFEILTGNGARNWGTIF